MQVAIRSSMFVMMLFLAAASAVVSVAGAETSATADGGERYITHADVRERFQVGIRLRVDRTISSRRMTDRLRKEVEAIWRPYGIQLEWTSADASEAAASGVSLDAAIERQLTEDHRMGGPMVLGDAVVGPDIPNWQAIRVSFDAIQKMLALRPSQWSAERMVPEHELARAVGRVLAHEIGHQLLGPPYHDRVGLMRAVFRANELAEPSRTRFRLTCTGVDRLRSRMRALTGYPHLVTRRHAARLDFEGLVDTRRESRGQPSCIAMQPTQ